MDRKRPPTFSVDGLIHGMGFQTLRRELSAPADYFRCKVGRDRRTSVARGAAPCTERSDAKQPGHSTVRTVCLAERTYSRHESIEVRPCYQGIFSSLTEFCRIKFRKFFWAADIAASLQRLKGAGSQSEQLLKFLIQWLFSQSFKAN